MFVNLVQSIQNLLQKKFLLDIFKTFIGVFLAFWVSEWKAAKQSNFTERTALQEIRQELELDIKDLQINRFGHQQGLNAARYFRAALDGKPVGEDTLAQQYQNLLRNFVSIQHSAAYESVKARGLEIIGDDSLRTHIINLFDYHLETVEKLEEQYAPHDFFNFYYHHFNEKFVPYFTLGERGQWSFAKPLSQMPQADQKMVRMWLFRLLNDRIFMMAVYQQVETEMIRLRDEIDQHLAK
jgi:hypothetical protein